MRLSLRSGCAFRSTHAIEPLEHRRLLSAYSVTDLGVLPGGTNSSATAINDLGQIVGDSDSSVGRTHAFLYSGGIMTDLNPVLFTPDILGGFDSNVFGSYAIGINNAGQIIGNRDNHDTFIYGGGVVQSITTGATHKGVVAMNSRGQAVGWRQTLQFFENPFVYSNGAVSEIPGWQAGIGGIANAINDSGDIVGVAFGPDSFAFLETDGLVENLGTLGGATSGADAINATGQVVGSSATTSGTEHAFLYDGTAMHDLGTLPGASDSDAAAINDSGTVVGTSGGRPFLWTPSGGMEDLGTMLDAGGAGWTNLSAKAINAGGQIAATGTNAQGNEHALLLTPVSSSRAVTLGPLKLVGDFALDAASGRSVAVGSVEVGLAGVSAELKVDGTVSYGPDTIDASGKFSANFGGTWVPLFAGSAEIKVGSVTGTLATQAAGLVPPSMEPAGLAVGIDNIMFTAEGLAVRGSISLPDALGGLRVVANGPNALLVTAKGLSLTGGKLTLPDVDAKLFGLLPFDAKGMSLTYSADANSFTVQGEFSLPSFHNLTADLSGDNYFTISPAGVSLQGTISAQDFAFVPGVWELKQISVTVGPSQLAGSATMLIPGGVEVSASIGFLNGQFDSIGLAADKLNEAIGTTGVFLQKIGGSVDHVAASDPESPVFSGTLGLTYGPELPLSLPGFLGGDVSGSLLDLELSGPVSAARITGTGSLTLVGGLAKGTVSADLDLSQGVLDVTTDFSAFGGVVTANSSFTGDTSGNLTGSGTGTLTVPIGIPPFVKDFQLGSATLDLQYHKSSPISDDYIQAFGTVTLPFSDKAAGLRVTFDGKLQPIGVDGLPLVPTAAALARQSATAAPPAGSSADATFSVPSGTAYVLLQAIWTAAGNSVPVIIQAPDGATYTGADLNSGSIALVPSLSGSTQTTVAIENPLPGNWTISIADTSALGTVSFAGFQNAAELSVQITRPSTDATGKSVTVDYTTSGSDANGSVSLFYDTAGTGFVGVPIAEALPPGSGEFVWNTSTLNSGNYHVYAVVRDGDSVPAYTYGPGVVHVLPTVVAGRFVYNRWPQTLSFTFSGDVGASLSAAAFQILNLDTGAALTPADVAYDPNTRTASIALAGMLADGHYRCTISSHVVADAPGNHPAADYTLNFFSLAGDTNHDGIVNFSDLVTLARNYGMRSGATFASGDLNGDGTVDFKDLVILAANYGNTIAPAAAEPLTFSADPARSLASLILRRRHRR